MTEYVLGFAFTHDYANFNRVLLIRKTKPDWQAGKLNGIGGKIEPTDVSPHWAMMREFKEETGLSSLATSWVKFAVMEFPEAKVHCFVTFWNWKEFKKATSTTDEKVCSYELDERFFEKLNEEKALPNLHWLIPMALTSWWITDAPALCITELPESERLCLS